MQEKEQVKVDSTKREFIKKFGSYAATAPVGMYILMTPSSSAANTSGSTYHASINIQSPFNFNMQANFNTNRTQSEVSFNTNRTQSEVSFNTNDIRNQFHIGNYTNFFKKND